MQKLRIRKPSIGREPVIDDVFDIDVEHSVTNGEWSSTKYYGSTLFILCIPGKFRYIAVPYKFWRELMSASIASLAAENRDKSGTGPARALRRDGKVPAVIYAKGSETTNIALNANELFQQYKKGRFRSRLIELKVDGKAVRALPQAVQTHPVTDQIEHVDFLRVEKGSQLRVNVPVVFKNTDRCIGVKRGGVLNIVRHTVEFFCEPDAIPEQIEVDVLDLDIGVSLHIDSVSLPEGIEPTIKRNFTIATITGRGKADEEETTAAPAEGDTAEVEATAQKAEGGDAEKKEEKK